MKKVLFVVDENRRGGVSTALTNMLKVLPMDKYEIDVLVLHDQGEVLQDLPCNIIYGTPFFEAIDYSIKEIVRKKRLILLLKKIVIVLGLKTGLIEYWIRRERKKFLTNNYDIEIAFKDGFTAIFTAAGETSKKIHWLHSEYKKENCTSKYEKLFHKIYPKFDTIVAVSKGVENQFNNIYHLEKNTIVIPNVISVEDILYKAEDCQATFPDETINIVLVGRCHPDKGYMRFVEVVKEMKMNNELSAIQFHIIGDGPEKEVIQTYIDEEKLDEYIKLYGSKDNPFCYMKVADAVFLPSINESFGLVAVEAQIVGTPVIATRNAATEEIIEHGKTGFVIDNSKEGIRIGVLELQKREQLKQYKENLNNYYYNNLENVELIKRLLEV